jgi:DNA integrity scanning protein DisA with diadenylate cyclase activity/mannitol/fructose-specific phosphotransferase system IIA component (Ntr-type)
MELAEFVGALEIVELKTTTRAEAIREMAKAAGWGAKGFDLDQVLGAIEEREAAAQTIVADGFALPHAVIDWEGPYCAVLGRSRAGVEYGIRGSQKVHLIVLLAVGKNRHTLHLELFGAVAELLGSDELRKAIVKARGTRQVAQLLAQKAGIEPEEKPRKSSSVPRLNRVMVGQAIRLVEALSAQALLVAVDKLESLPWKQLDRWDGRLLLVAPEGDEELEESRPDTHLFEIPQRGLPGADRANLGLLLAASSGLLEGDARVVCVAGPEGARLDSMVVVEPRARLRSLFAERGSRRRVRLRPAVILRVLTLAIELAAEGREGHPVGTIFVVGDARRVMRHAQQLVLNPFHGFSRTLRNILDPSLAETIKEFSQIDGAFLLQDDGTVLTAGTYLAPEAGAPRLKSGLGVRHKIAAGITSHTEALAIAISQSTGTVSVFHHGRLVLELGRAKQTRW